MEQDLTAGLTMQLRQLLAEDSQHAEPVVQSIPLFFWDKLGHWIQQIALRPEPFIIALTGPSGCGKSFIRKTLVQELSTVSQVSSFTQDNYYRDFEADFHHLPLARFYDEINFDDPNHIQFHHLERDLQRLKTQALGSTLKIPRLRFGTPLRKPSIVHEGLSLQVTPFVVTEGIHAFYAPETLPLYDLKIYVSVDEASRRQRWLARNHSENRGVTDNMWKTTVECLDRHILPSRDVADLVLNNNASQARVATFLKSVMNLLTTPLVRSHREIA